MSKSLMRRPKNKKKDGSWSEVREGMRIDWDVAKPLLEWLERFKGWPVRALAVPWVVAFVPTNLLFLVSTALFACVRIDGDLSRAPPGASDPQSGGRSGSGSARRSGSGSGSGR